MNTPKDIVDYILKEGLESEFLLSVSRFKNDYTIGEIADGEFYFSGNSVKFRSKGFGIDVDVDDDNVAAAACTGMYISSFISRHGNAYQVHFLTHAYPDGLREKFAEDIVKEVVRYMILKTVKALRLDTADKVKEYITK